MSRIHLPKLDWSWQAGPPVESAVQKWQERLRQVTRQWMRAGAPVTDWLYAYNALRTDLLRCMWNEMIPEDHRVDIEYITLGSTARQEDVFDSDLDYALLLHKPVNMEAVRPQLYRFVERMDALGFPPCKGFVMGTNVRWSGTVEEWQQRVQSYFQFPDWENVRYLFILLDSRVLTGQSLTHEQGDWEQLRSSVQEQLRLAPYLCWEMAHLGIQNTVSKARVNPAVLRFGHGSIDIKNGLLNPVLHSIRLLAVAHQVFAVNTERRLLELTRCGALDRDLMHRLEGCVDYAWRTRIKQYIDNPYTGTSTHEVPFFRMSLEERHTLARHLDTAKKLERMILRRFRKPR